MLLLLHQCLLHAACSAGGVSVGLRPTQPNLTPNSAPAPTTQHNTTHPDSPPTLPPRYASKVYVVHRFNYLEASRIMARKALANPKIEVLWESEVVEAHGSEEGEQSGAALAWLRPGRVLPCACVWLGQGCVVLQGDTVLQCCSCHGTRASTRDPQFLLHMLPPACATCAAQHWLSPPPHTLICALSYAP